ncbi:GNAT family N-acetyltransferase [Vibrio vulnificus]
MEVVSERLRMKPLSENDWPLFLQLHTNPSVISLCFDELPKSEIESKFKSRLAPWFVKSKHWLCLAVVESKTDKAVGITGFCVNDSVAEVGFMFLPEYHGLGYGTVSLQALINYSMSEFGIDKYSAVVTEGNIGSEKVLTKVGFVLDRIVPQAYEIGGHLYADHVYQYA